MLFHLGRNHAGARDVVAVFGGVTHRPALLGDTTFVDEVHDQLELVQHLKVGNFGLVAGFGENFEAVLDQLRGSTTKHGLLAKEVSFGFLGEGGDNSTRAETTESLGVRPGEIPCSAGGVVFDRDNDGNTAAGDVFAAHSVARALGGDQDHVDTCRGLDVAEANVEAVAEHESFAVSKVRGDVFGVETTLVLVGRENHDHVGPGGRLRGGHDLEASVLSLLGGFGTGLQGNNHLDTGVAQVLRVCVAL